MKLKKKMKCNEIEEPKILTTLDESSSRKEIQDPNPPWW